MGDLLSSFLTRLGARVSVEGREFRIGIDGGVVYVNGLPAEQYRDEADNLLILPDGGMHLPLLYLDRLGLPSMCLHQTRAGLSVRLGTRYYLHALPDGQLLGGGPGLAEQDLLLIRPGTNIQYGGPNGIVIEAPLINAPENEKEVHLVVAFIVGTLVGPAVFRFVRFVLHC